LGQEGICTTPHPFSEVTTTSDRRKVLQLPVTKKRFHALFTFYETTNLIQVKLFYLPGIICSLISLFSNRLTPNDPYMGRTAPLTSKRRILYVYSTNIGTEYFKHALYSPFFSLQIAVCFITLTCLVPVLFTFYIQDVLKLKK
jgi:hypothetical protein